MKGRMRLYALLLAMMFLAAGCGSSSDGSGYSKFIVIDQPSAVHPVLAEKRDFYVIGWFNATVSNPGNIRVELFKGNSTDGDPIRMVTSNVSPATGTTSPSDIYLDYEYGNNFSNSSGAKLSIVPDVVMSPGGLFNATNKCVVTDEYYAALIYGGVTKNFDIDYMDDAGHPYEDLTNGTYTIRVTGLSGNLQGMVDEKIMDFGRTHVSLGRFSPSTILPPFLDYAGEHDYTVLMDLLPGYFSMQGMTYEIRNRLFPNNSIEVVNYLSGTIIDTPANAANNILMYNINDSCATERVEIAAIIKYGLMNTNQTTVNYYDIGEPYISYLDFEDKEIQLNGTIVDFAIGDFLELTRAEIEAFNGTYDNNYYNTGDRTPKELDTDFTDGVYMGAHDKLAVFGVVKQIQSELTPLESTDSYSLDDRIRTITFNLSRDGEIVWHGTADVDMVRIYPPDSEKQWHSMYEFKQVFHVPAPGDYLLTCAGLDTRGRVITGTLERVEIHRD